MRSVLPAVLLLACLAPASTAAQRATPESALTVRLAHGSAPEIETKAALEGLLKHYDLSRWIFTREIVIDEKTRIPHSHPVLTLSTGYAGRELLLLSVFVHEQMHWFLNEHPEDRDRAITALEEMFPDLPTHPPGGSNGRFSSYQHVVVCFLELAGMEDLVGEQKARAVFKFWAGHHYRAIYRLVLDRTEEVRGLVEKYNLTPSAPAPSGPPPA